MGYFLKTMRHVYLSSTLLFPGILYAKRNQKPYALLFNAYVDSARRGFGHCLQTVYFQAKEMFT